jgi:RimJ/RimL family protein N-acetyltransferase
MAGVNLLLEVPAELGTERLELRAPRAGDGEVINAAVVESIGEVGRWMPWARPTPTVEQSETWVREACARFVLRQEIAYLMFVRETGELAGVLSLFDIVYSVPRAEVGYWQRTRLCGRGYVTEAVRGVVRVGFEVLKAERLQIQCDARNERSARVAERCGFALEGTLRHNARDNEGALRDTHVYAMVRGEYLARRDD